MRIGFLAIVLALALAVYVFWRMGSHSPSPGRFNAPPIHMPKQGILM